MNKGTCKTCGVEFGYPAGVGRPRAYCDDHRRVYPRREGRGRHIPVSRSGECVVCGSEFTGIRSKKYCSTACKWVAHKADSGIPCTVCGEPTAFHRSTGKTDAKHQRCSLRPCGTVSSYRRHLKYGEEPCQPCRDAVAEETREYAARRKERDGVSLWSQYRKYDGDHGHFIPRADRLAIYERDGWVCQLCGDPVDRDLHYNHRFAATLDHIEPQSMVLIPDHSPENLQLAHRACNSRRNNKVVTEGGALRVRPDGRSTEDLARSS